jgi:hypothetical protein
MPEWAGIVAVNAKRYLKSASDHTIRNRVILNELKKRGRILYNENGDDLSWQMEYRQPPVQQAADGQTIDFVRQSLYKRATIEWRGYNASDALTEKVKEMNKGNVALIKYYADKLPKLVKAVTNRLDDDCFIDGNATGNEDALHGLESFCGTGTTAAGDKIAKPSDTYAGLSTAAGNYGGTWSSNLTTSPNASLATDWPDGSGDVEYDFNSPIIINWSSTAWTGTATWISTAERCLRAASLYAQHTQGKEGMIDVFMLSNNLFYDYANLQAAKMQINIPYKPAQDLGFGSSMLQEGVGVMPAYGVAANTGYGINFDQMELRCLYPQLLKEEGPEFDIRTGSYLFNVRFFGNLKFESPKWFVKLKNVA